MPWDSRYWIPAFLRGTWILDSSRYRDSVFLGLYFEFQSPGLLIVQARLYHIADSTSKNYLDSGIQIPFTRGVGHNYRDQQFCYVITLHSALLTAL